MSTMRDFHADGRSVDDALALLTASFGDDHARAQLTRLRVIADIAEDPDAGSRVAAAIEALAAIAAGIIEVYVPIAGDDPEQVVRDFALLDRFPGARR